MPVFAVTVAETPVDISSQTASLTSTLALEFKHQPDSRGLTILDFAVAASNEPFIPLETAPGSPQTAPAIFVSTLPHLSLEIAQPILLSGVPSVLTCRRTSFAPVVYFTNSTSGRRSHPPAIPSFLRGSTVLAIAVLSIDPASLLFQVNTRSYNARLNPMRSDSHRAPFSSHPSESHFEFECGARRPAQKPYHPGFSSGFQGQTSVCMLPANRRIYASDLPWFCSSASVQVFWFTHFKCLNCNPLFLESPQCVRSGFCVPAPLTPAAPIPRTPLNPNHPTLQNHGATYRGVLRALVGSPNVLTSIPTIHFLLSIHHASPWTVHFAFGVVIDLLSVGGAPRFHSYLAPRGSKTHGVRYTAGAEMLRYEKETIFETRRFANHAIEEEGRDKRRTKMGPVHEGRRDRWASDRQRMNEARADAHGYALPTTKSARNAVRTGMRTGYGSHSASVSSARTKSSAGGAAAAHATFVCLRCTCEDGGRRGVGGERGGRRRGARATRGAAPRTACRAQSGPARPRTRPEPCFKPSLQRIPESFSPGREAGDGGLVRRARCQGLQRGEGRASGFRAESAKHVIQMLLAKKRSRSAALWVAAVVLTPTTVNHGRFPTTPHSGSRSSPQHSPSALTSKIDVYPPLNRGHSSSFRAPFKLKLFVEPRVPTTPRFPGPLTDFLREKGAHRSADAAVLAVLGAEDPAALVW
ncbi:hypothetical protein B0H17DRAFT_1150871 [Mycena rosella]|uniref:Uncharacterized protein n=1 Tax=Mycena rosella TaxID=1033263 RepID=A0AAD7FJN1_MYCRO|nr:hypothetical protein B0H17DRAFT_1150871 [Mycena rosella]